MIPPPRILRPGDFRVMPWKNGLGTTTEIAAFPEGAGLDAFTWRVSMATIGASGPFSAFPGVDRVIVQLEGEPVTLAHEGRADHVLALLVPHRFPGEVATDGRIAEPPARDFNVMVRRDRASAEVVVHQLGPGEAARDGAPAHTRIAFAWRGSVDVVAADARLTAGEGEALIASGDAISIVAGSDGAIVIVAEIAAPRAGVG